MIEINLYRIRIGTFQQRSRKQRVGKIEKKKTDKESIFWCYKFNEATFDVILLFIYMLVPT